MAVFREQPYGNFNFLVSLGDADAESVMAGFFEVILPSAEVEVTEYRRGNSKLPTPEISLGLPSYGHATLRRGLVGSTDLWEWFQQSLNGTPQPRDVTVSLLNSNHETVMQWRLGSAVPVRYTGPYLNANESGMAMEEVVLTIERLEVE